MCGIFCEILGENESKTSDSPCVNQQNQIFDQCRTNLERRGPNSIREEIVDGIRFFGTVLHHQGLKPTEQPVVNEDFVLLFNGDLFMDLELYGESDTDHLVSLLAKLRKDSDLREVIGTLRGPYSLVYYNRIWKKLYFARDPMGRNSLLIGSVQGRLFLSSACCYNLADHAAEVPPIGLFCVDVINDKLSVCPWYNIISHPFYQEQIDVLNIKLNKRLEVRETENISLSWLELLQLDEFTLHDMKDLSTSDMWPSEVKEACDTFIEILSKSVKERATLTSNYCKACLNGIDSCNHCRIGILFSGGLDCSILAVLADKVIHREQSIDLFNVAFEKVKRVPNPRQHKLNAVDQSINWDVPDRLTAKLTIQELKELCPDRQWNLVEVNVTRNELEQELNHHLRDLISPSKNILDESLGAALWFAARGKGVINQKPHESNCRVLLLGSGADELFGGYSRHRNAFKRAIPGESELILTQELDLDWIRLPNRNLARDDRVISDHSTTPRTPYLQEDVIQFVRSLKANQRCNLLLEPGVGDKLFLRLCAYKLGLRRCSLLKKRALQFGSRIADSRQKADTVSTYFQE